MEKACDAKSSKDSDARLDECKERMNSVKAMKRTASMFLTLVMVLSLCTVGASADTNTATISAKDASGVTVGTGYTSLAAAAAAAGEYGTVEITSGTVYYDVRQSIATNNVTLKGEGIGITTIQTSSSFGSASETNRKALLTITAENVTVQDISFDGGTYGRNLVPDNTAATQFNVVRVNSGSATFDNVSITGSKRTLLSVGMSNSYAEVTANGLICQGLDKIITNGVAYADVSIVNGKLTLDEDCVIDAFICLDSNNNPRVLDSTDCAGLYTLNSPVTILFYTYYVEVTTTLKHFAHSYTTCNSNSERDKYATAENYSGNSETLEAMVEEATNNLEDGTVTDDDLQIAEDLLSALAYGIGKYPANQDIQDWYDSLNSAYNAVVNQS